MFRNGAPLLALPLLVANGFARIELDFDSLSFAFAPFGAAAPTGTEIRGLFEEYEKNHLIFAYDADAQRWGQWDTKHGHLKHFKTAADKKSPHPPEPEYRRWLVDQHGDDWPAFHWNKDAGDDAAPESEVVAQFSLSLANSSGRTEQDLVGSSPELTKVCPLGLGVGMGTGMGIALESHRQTTAVLLRRQLSPSTGRGRGQHPGGEQNPRPSEE